MKKHIISLIVVVFIFSIINPFTPEKETQSAAEESLPISNAEEKENNHPSEDEKEDPPIETVEKDLLKDTTYTNDEGMTMVKNTDDILVLVNKNRNLPEDYKPEDLVIPNVRFPFKEFDEKKQLRKEAASALEELFNHAEEEGIYLFAVSGYRSYARQKYLFDYRAKKDGFEAANKLTAYPGQSEHQTGLAMDVSCEALGFDLREEFGQTVEGKWLKENAHKYGFIIRYPKEAVDITGYSYEPWHIRYVGEKIANEIYEKNITLEEYLGDKSSIPVLNQ